MRPTAAEFAMHAERAEGARWRRHGRSLAIGFDCGGYPAWALAQVGIHVALPRDYDAGMPSPAMLWRLARDVADETAWQDQGEGRVGICSWGSDSVARHIVVMLARRRIAHVDAGVRRVTIVPAGWLDGRLLAVFRVRGLDYGEPW